MPPLGEKMTPEHAAAISRAKRNSWQTVREMHAIIVSMDKRLAALEKLLRERKAA